jgi:hypothetical protein
MKNFANKVHIPECTQPFLNKENNTIDLILTTYNLPSENKVEIDTINIYGELHDDEAINHNNANGQIETDEIKKISFINVLGASKQTKDTVCINGASLTPDTVYIDSRVNENTSWVGGYFRGRYQDCSHIILEWDIDENIVGEIKNYKLYRRAWDKTSYTLIKSFTANEKSYVDIVDPNATKPVWYYALYAYKAIPDDKQISSTTIIWQIKDFYTKESLKIRPNTKVWLANSPGNSLSPESRLCLADTTQWSKLSKKIGGIALYRSSIQSGSITELRSLTNTLNKLNIPLGVETGGFQNITTTEKSLLGEKSFESEMRAYKNLLTPTSQGGAGGRLDYIFFDGPIHSAIYPNNLDLGLITIEEAAWELTDLMLLWRQNYPQIKFYLISNFSNWGWNGEPARNTHKLSQLGWGEYKTVLETLIPLARQRGVPFSGIISDYAYEAFLNEGSSDQIEVIKNIDYRTRLKELSDYVKNENMSFIMCLNEVRGGYSNNAVYSMNTINYLEEALQYGIEPDEVIVQSWNPFPDAWLPESQLGTMTNLCSKIIDRLQLGTSENAVSSNNELEIISSTDKGTEISIYPNPVNTYFQVRTNDIVQKIEIYNLLGNLVFEILNPYKLEFDLTSFPSGIYLIKINTINSTYSTKIFKKINN